MSNLTVEEFKRHVDLVHVIGRDVQLAKSGRAFTGLCPFHDDKTPSLAIDPVKGLWHCFGCKAGGDVVEYVRKKHNVAFAEALRMLAAESGLEVPEAALPSLRTGQPLSDEEIRILAKRLWDYRDEQGAVLFRVVRCRDTNTGKRFAAYRPAGNGRWLPGLGGARRVLYRLPELLASSPSELVFIVEGEKDADRLAEAGLIATTNPFGAGNWKPEFTPPFRGREVAIISDNDEVGRKHARQVATSLLGVAAAVKVVELPDLPVKGDVSDFLDADRTKQDLLHLVANAHAVDPREDAEEPPAHHTDLGNAERLVKHHGRDLRYCDARKKWLHWDGRRWAVDDTGEVMRRAKDTVTRIYGEAANEQDSNQRKTIAEHAKRSESESRLRAMVALAQSEPGIPVDPADLDRDPWKLNVINGTLDLRTGDLLPHSRDDLITKLAPAAHDPSAQCLRWQAFLERIFDGDANLIRFIQRAVGYGLTGSTKEQVLFLLYGTGANGKSTLLEVLRTLLGDYARTADFDTFLRKERSGARNDIARLAGARLVTAQEMESGARLAESVVKQLTGGDTVQARFLYAEFFEFRPVFKLFLAANHKPEIRGSDHAIWRRIRLVPFTVTIPDEEQDRDLVEKLKGELPGILAWAVRGCLDWQRSGLGSTTVVSTATREYQAESDTLGAFLAECCVVGSSYTASAFDLYSRFKEWAGTNGEHVVSQTAFGRQLGERGFEKRKRAGRNFWNGLGMATGDSGDSLDGFPEKSYARNNRGDLTRKPSNHPPTIPNGHTDASPDKGQFGDGREGCQPAECPF